MRVGIENRSGFNHHVHYRKTGPPSWPSRERQASAPGPRSHWRGGCTVPGRQSREARHRRNALASLYGHRPVVNRTCGSPAQTCLEVGESVTRMASESNPARRTAIPRARMRRERRFRAVALRRTVFGPLRQRAVGAAIICPRCGPNPAPGLHCFYGGAYTPRARAVQTRRKAMRKAAGRRVGRLAIGG